MSLKIIVTNCRECPFFGSSMLSLLSKADGSCGCPERSGPMHVIEMGGTSDHDKAARAHQERRRMIPSGKAASVPDWCPLKARSLTVTLGS